MDIMNLQEANNVMTDGAGKYWHLNEVGDLIFIGEIKLYIPSNKKVGRPEKKFTPEMLTCAGCQQYRTCDLYRGIPICQKDWGKRKMLYKIINHQKKLKKAK